MPSWRSPWPPRAPRLSRSARRCTAIWAASRRCLLPVPMMNIINGGAHADNSVDLQEFMIAPFGAAEVLRSAAHGRGGVPHSEKGSQQERLLDRGRRRGRLRPHAEIQRGSHRIRPRGDHAGRLPAGRRRSASASTRPRASSSRTASTSSRSRTRASARPSRWCEFWANWVRQYPAILSIEDGMAEDDWAGWKLLTDAVGDKVQLVGDDLFVTNTVRLKRGIDERRRQFDSGQGQPDRHAHRDARSHADGGARRLHRGGVAPLGRNRRSVHRRSRGGHRRGPDQDRLRQPHRPHRQVQPVAAHRREARRGGAVPRAERRSADDEARAASATARARGTRRTASPAGPMWTCPRRAGRKRRKAARC